MHENPQTACSVSTNKHVHDESVPKRWCIRLLSEQSPHPLKHAVFLRVIRMIFRRYLEQRRECCRVCLDAMSYLLGNVLVDEENGDILALGREAVECCFDGRILGLCVDDEEVLLTVRWLRDVLGFPSISALYNREIHL